MAARLNLVDFFTGMSIPLARRMNLVALALLITALIAFIAFHFLVVEIFTEPGMSGIAYTGWEVWPSLIRVVSSGDFDDIPGMIAASAFLTCSVLVIASPFIVPILQSSRLAWWVVAIGSGSAMCGLGGMILIEPHDPEFSVPGPGLYCLLATLALNFIGLLFIRREPRLEPAIDG